MRCKIVRFQKLMWRNMMRSTKSQKVSILHYNYSQTRAMHGKYLKNLFLRDLLNLNIIIF